MLCPGYRLPHFYKKIKQRLLAAFIFCNPKMPVLTIWRLAMLGGWPHSGFCLPLAGGLTSTGKYRNPLCHNVGSKIRKIIEHSRNYKSRLLIGLLYNMAEYFSILYFLLLRKSITKSVTVHKYPVNVTAYAHLKSPAAMGHMLCPRNGTGPWLISGGISHGVNSNIYFFNKEAKIFHILQNQWYNR